MRNPKKAGTFSQLLISHENMPAFHKGFTKIIDIWKKLNARSNNKLGIVRDFDDQPKAQEEHEKRQSYNIIVRTTQGYTLETDITNKNYDLLKRKYGATYGWCNMSADKTRANTRRHIKFFIFPPGVKNNYCPNIV